MSLVFSPADILIPKCDLSKWAVIACDQYTSEPEYWEKVKEIVGDSPSSLKITLPEIYLEKDNKDKTGSINSEMKKYLDSDLFKVYKDSIFYVERTQSDGMVRHEIIGKIDLEEYDYNPKTTAAVRASEKTVVSRIPPRVKIRREAPLELPHVLLLTSDPCFSLLKIIEEGKPNFEKVYDFKLMQNGGHIKAWTLDIRTRDNIIAQLEAIRKENDGFLFCVGDGNHSLATAKECYNKNKSEKSRYALVSVVNIHDKALQFEPIYRVCFGEDPKKIIDEFISFCGGEYKGRDAQRFEAVFGDERTEIFVKPLHRLPVGTLQIFLDEYSKKNGDLKIDYIHGENSLIKICKSEKAVGFLFGGMGKEELFDSVKLEGSLPRKTFSMGHADDKRFYIEARKIK